MFRSVVSALAANMMLVQMQFRCAHLIVVLDFDRQQSGPRHHRNRVRDTQIGGTSKACGQTGNGWGCKSSGRLKLGGV